MEELGVRWGELSAEQKAAYDVAPRPAAVEPRGPEPQPLRPPWPSIADDYFPIAEGSLGDVPGRVGQLHKEWKARCARGMCPQAARMVE